MGLSGGVDSCPKNDGAEEKNGTGWWEARGRKRKGQILLGPQRGPGPALKSASSVPSQIV